MVEAYKASEECHQEKLVFVEPTFAKGMKDTRRMVAKHYPFLNLNFLDEEDQDKGAPTEGVPTPKV